MLHPNFKHSVCLSILLAVGYVHAQTPFNLQLQSILSTLPGMNAPQSPKWVSLAQKGIELRKEGKLEEAATAFMPALTLLKEHESSSDIWVVQFGLIRTDMLLAFGDVLNRLNRPDEAIPLLLKAAEIEQDELTKRAQNPKLSMSNIDAMSAFQSSISTAINMARQMNRKYIVVESDAGTKFEESLVEQLPDTLLTSLLLADAYSRKGGRQSVVALYENQFQDYLRRQKENTNSAARFNLDLAIESACLRFALVLARVGPSPQQEQAFKCALDMNLKNQRMVGTNAIVASAQEGVASQRRLFVGAYADQAMRNSAPETGVQRHLVELIADSKGLGTRYTQRVRQLLFHSTNPTLVNLRPKFDELEKSRKDLPISGTPSVLAMVEWENARAALMREALPSLNKEGLGDIFLDGATLLKRVQQKLVDEVLIGFSIYKPIDLKTMAPMAGRVLRYSVTKDEVEIQDIGTQKEIESLVYRWRSAVATNADTASDPLAQRLLGGLPSAVLTAKSWIIDPDGAISLLPFEALYKNNGNAVIVGHAVRYVTSLASFASTPNLTVTSRPTALVIANPQFSGNTTGTDASAIARSVPTATGVLLENMRFSQLPSTAIEATRVQNALKRLGVDSDLRLGNRATLDALNFTSTPRYLHIATHGIYMAPGTDPNSKAFIRVATAIPGMQSALVFTPSANGSIFTGADFARLSLYGTELVVLSACDTGNGSLNVGEGVESLRMAVEEAGAKSSVTSLWPVPSGATAQLMGEFYDRLGQGHSKVESLRGAKLELMKSYPAPSNWAGFLLTGQP